MSQRRVFYVWQRDTPRDLNYELIGEALERATTQVGRDLAIELSVDRDTLNVPGTPDIVETILKKIQQSSALVVDLTFVARIANEHAGKGIPNPNAMMELGFALEAIGWENIIVVFNEAFGPIQELPFDITGRRLSAIYHCSEEADVGERERVCATLSRDLATRLREIITSAGSNAANDDFPSPFEESQFSFVNAAKIGSADIEGRGIVDVFWKNTPLAFIRVIPRAPISIPSRVQLKELALGGDPSLEPFGRWTEAWHSQNEWGFCVMGGIHDEGGVLFPWNIGQLFRSSEIWGLDRSLLRENENFGGARFIPSVAMERVFDERTASYVALAHRRLGVVAPVKIIMGLAMIEGLQLVYGSLASERSDRCAENVVIHEAILEPNIEEMRVQAVDAFLAKVWDACGMEHVPTRG